MIGRTAPVSTRIRSRREEGRLLMERVRALLVDEPQTSSYRRDLSVPPVRIAGYPKRRRMPRPLRAASQTSGRQDDDLDATYSDFFAETA